MDPESLISLNGFSNSVIRVGKQYHSLTQIGFYRSHQARPFPSCRRARKIEANKTFGLPRGIGLLAIGLCLRRRSPQIVRKKATDKLILNQ